MPLNVTFSTGSKTSLTLADIEELYLSTRDWDRKTRVDVSAHRGLDQRDPSTVTMKVTMDPRLDNAPKPVKRG